MDDYKQMYLVLFNSVTDALDDLHRQDCAGAARRLAQAQCRTEELFLRQEKGAVVPWEECRRAYRARRAKG